jgi:hypothetical protein
MPIYLIGQGVGATTGLHVAPAVCNKGAPLPPRPMTIIAAGSAIPIIFLS